MANSTKINSKEQRRTLSLNENDVFHDAIFDEGSEKVMKPQDKRVERLKKRRSQFSSSSTFSEGGTSFSETSTLFVPCDIDIVLFLSIFL